MNAGVKRNTKRAGDIAELRVMCDLVRAGYRVAIPFGEDNRYDLIVDKDGVLSRVQVKSGRLRNGAIVFNCYSSHTHRGGVSCRRYLGEIEYFAVYCADVEAVYLIPAADLSVAKGILRLEPSRNNQGKKIRWAAPYMLNTGRAAQVGTAVSSGVACRSSIAPP